MCLIEQVTDVVARAAAVCPAAWRVFE